MKDVHIILGAPKREEIAPLIKSDGIIIGVDRGVLFAIDENLQVDIALGDFDSVSEAEMDKIKKNNTKLLDFPSDKDDTDAELAFVYVLKNYNTNNIYVYNWYGGRVDHLYSILMLAVQKRFEIIVPNLRFVTTNNFIQYYLPGKYTIPRMKEMDYLSYVLLTEVKGLTLKKVKYELANKDFNHPLALISNEFLEDEAEFSFKEGIIAAIQSRDEEK